MWVRSLAIVVYPSCVGDPRFPGRISLARSTMRRPALQLLWNAWPAWPLSVAAIPASTAFAVASGLHGPDGPLAPGVVEDPVGVPVDGAAVTTTVSPGSVHAPLTAPFCASP